MRLLLNRATYMCGVRVIRALSSSGLPKDASPDNSPYLFAEP
ncbi:hypothetical protein [Nostoc piscinale]|nr:hypothetical protein [Nostoc piscinale]